MLTQSNAATPYTVAQYSECLWFDTYKTLRKQREHTTESFAYDRELLADTDLQKYEDVFHLYVDPTAVSLDTPTTHDDGDGYLHELIAGDVPDVDDMLRSVTLTAIAHNNNISRERARQLRESALRRLKKYGISFSAR